MHHLAPIPIIFGVAGAILGLLWLVSAGTEQDGGPETGLFTLFGWWYIGFRATRQLFSEPMSVLPAIGILIGSGGLIWLGVAML